MNFGMIGFGNIAKRFFESIQLTDNGKVTAIGSKSLYQEGLFNQEHPEINVYQSYDEVLTDPKVEAIYIALPHGLHKEWALKALELKIPVFCEKPATLYVKDMEEIKLASQKNQTLFLEAFKTKFNVGMDHLKEDLPLVGSLISVEANFCSKVTGRDSQSYLFKEGEGGALNDIGTYVLGFILDLVDSPLIKIDSKLKIENKIDEQFEGTLYFENGVLGLFEGAIDREKERTAIIKGALGEIIVPYYNRMENYQIILNNGEKIERAYPIEGDDMTMEIEVFMSLVEEGKQESERHTFQETELIIETMETIRNS